MRVEIPTLEKPIPFDEWPIALKYYSLRRKNGDTGIGDILERSFGKIGGNLFKKFWKSVTGKECGCGKRKEWLNERYPLPNKN